MSPDQVNKMETDLILNHAFDGIIKLAYSITDEEFNRAKNCQATTTGFNLERQLERIDESCRNILYFNSIRQNIYNEWI